MEWNAGTDERAGEGRLEVSTALRKLDEPVTVTSQSNEELAGRVRRQIRKLDEEREERGDAPHERKGMLAPVEQLKRGHGMRITPWELLHTLSRATVLGRHGSSRALAQHWEALRYITALQANSHGHVELSEDGKDPRYHRKAVQAKDLGIAFGLAAAQHAVQLQYPDYRFDVVDTELALEAGWPLRGVDRSLRESTKVHPNFLLVGRKPGRPMRVVSVDCKGTHGGDDYQHEQLARSAAHIPRIVLGHLDEGGGPPPSLVVTTAIAGTGGIETRLLDPEGDGLLAVPGKSAPDLAGPVEEKNELPVVPFTNAHGGEDSRAGFCIPEDDWEWFSRVLARSTAATLLSFAGDRGTARTMLTRRQQNRLGSGHHRTNTKMQCDTGITLGGMSFVGTDHVFRLDGQRVEVFSGVREHLHQLLVEERLDEHEVELAAAMSTWRRGKAQAKQEWGGVISMDSAGALLAIRKQRTRHSKQLP